MINGFVFEFQGPIAVDQYLLGSPHWSIPMGLINGRLICKAGASTDPTVFALEIDGVLIGKTFPVFPRFAGDTVNLVFNIGTVLPENTAIRIKCISGPADPDDAIRAIGFNLSADEASTVVPVDADLFVRWVDGSESFRIFEYSTSTHLFTESVTGISSGRATIDNATTFLATIRSVTVAQANSSQQLHVNEIICNGGTATTESPRLEFFIGSTRVATLTATGKLYVSDVNELASFSAEGPVFSLYGNAVLSAVLGAIDSGPNMLTAIECCEPV